MRLAAAAKYFDRTTCADAYNPSITFMAQLDLFDDSKRDGATVARRVLSVAPDVAIPARRAVTVHGETFVLGELHNDSFSGDVVRVKYVAHRTDGLASIQTLDQAVRSIAGSTAYGARLWVKDQKEIEISSRLSPFFALYFAPTETIAIGSIVTLAGRLHIVRQAFTSAAGFLLCEADEMPAAAATTVVYTDKSGQAYDAATDTMGALSPATVPAIWHRFQAGFDYFQPGAPKLEEGDFTLNVSKTHVAAAATGDRFVMSGVTYRVLDARDNGANVWTLHARRA